MTDRDIEEVYDCLFSLQTMGFMYNGIIYQFQAFNGGELLVNEFVSLTPDGCEVECIIEHDFMYDLDDCFFNAPVFEGKTFWEVVDDIEWHDY